MSSQRIRILSSLLVAFIIVNLYGRLSKTPFISPVQANNIKSLLSSIKFNPNSLIKLFTIKFESKPKETELVSRLDNRNNSFSLTPIVQPSPTIVIPTIPGNVAPISPVISGVANPTTYIIPTKIPTKIPTSIPKPTNTPKPTKIPDLPPVTSDVRPGSSLEEIFQEVSKRMCIPAALLMAFKTEETGERFKNDNAKTIQIYNTYGWWKTGAGDPCYGYGYYTQIGIVPPDSVNAGVRCSKAIGNPTDIKIMGVLQISEWEEQVSRKNTKGILPDNIDRRVIFDNAIIFASITKNRIGTTPKSCDDWPDDAILTAAEKHQGVCVNDYHNGNTVNYCQDVLRLYKQYR